MSKKQKGRQSVWAVIETTKAPQIQGLFDTRQLAEQFLLTPRWNHKFFETRVQRNHSYTVVTCHLRAVDSFTDSDPTPTKTFLVSRQPINYKK